MVRVIFFEPVLKILTLFFFINLQNCQNPQFHYNTQESEWAVGIFILSVYTQCLVIFLSDISRLTLTYWTLVLYRHFVKVGAVRGNFPIVLYLCHLGFCSWRLEVHALLVMSRFQEIFSAFCNGSTLVACLSGIKPGKLTQSWWWLWGSQQCLLSPHRRMKRGLIFVWDLSVNIFDYYFCLIFIINIINTLALRQNRLVLFCLYCWTSVHCTITLFWGLEPSHPQNP